MQALRAVRFVVASVLAGLMLSPTAAASFPGANGRLVVSEAGGGRYPGGGYNFISAYSPAGRRRFLRRCYESPTTRCPGAVAPSFSPDGRRIIYSTLDGLAIMDADGSDVRLLGRSGADPAWSPDGRWLAFSRSPGPGAVPEIFRARSTDGRGLQRLTFGGGRAPDWSVRGRIAYMRCPEAVSERGCHVRVVRTDGRGDRRILERAAYPSWSPDGRRLAVSRHGPGDGSVDEDDRRIWTLDADGGDRERVFSGNAYAPAWSPDGRKIAFQSSTQDDFELTMSIIDADGGDPELVRADPGFDSGFTSGPDWQPLPRKR